MDTLLVVGAALAIVLAAVMSFVAFKLLRETRARSAARVAALESLVLADEAEPDAFDAMRLAPSPRPEPAPEPDPEPAPAIAYASDESFDDGTGFDDLDGLEEPSWDGALHPDSYGIPPSAPIVPARAADRRARAHRPNRVTARRAPARHAPIAIPDTMFNDAQERGAPRRRWAVLAGVAVVVMSLAGSAYAMRGADVFSTLSLPSIRSAIGRPTQTTPLELLSLRHTADRSGGFTITGLVQNPATGRPVDHVVAVVYLFDKQGRYFASGRAALTPDALVPGAESPFEISIPDAQGVGRYRVGFRLENGGVVSHVDRRGSEPLGTTGDAVETSDGRGPSPVTATPIGRVEGD